MAPAADPNLRLQLDSPVLQFHVTDPTPANESVDKLDRNNGQLSPNGTQQQMETMSLSEDREVAHRLNDDLELLRVERIVSKQEHDSRNSRRSRSRNRSQMSGVHDAFNTTAASIPAVKHEPKKSTWLTRLWVLLKKFPRVLRYVVYAIPAGILILIPVFLDLFAYDGAGKPVGGNGGVKLLWFGIWLEVVWLTLWAARIATSIMPFIIAWIADTVGSANHKKWKDIGRQLEFPTALFLWLLAVMISYYPILNGHRDIDDGAAIPDIFWIGMVYKIITALFVLATLNFVEKILIQWIAASFHRRTYSLRIRENHAQINYLVALYTYAKTRLEAQDPVWDSSGGQGSSSGNRTPMKTIQDNARQAWAKVGNAANRMAGDFTGRRILKGNHPKKVVLELLRETSSSYTLARVFYRTFVQPGRSTIVMEDFLPAFASQEEAEACFGVFDKDLNGDISMEELEMVCNEIHLEKKAIAASLKDLDSVIKKLDSVFMFIIVVIVIVVFISILSNSAAAALTSTGTVLLGLSWLLQATAQEFLQSIIFVFVKHPFDVGDRVTVYGNTGSMMRGDDYYVLEVSLLYTEFKKMEGHVVQAPNSLLNTLFILNQRRSQGLADPVNLTVRFGTTEEQIEELKARMLQFCLKNQRDYAPRIISEVRTIDEVYSINMNIIFFHKSNFQNELLRLNRHNKFAVELMRQMREMGIEGPRVQQPGGMANMPIYWSNVSPPPAYSQNGNNPQNQPPAQPTPAPAPAPTPGSHSGFSASAFRQRAESRAAVVESGMDFQDVYQNRRPDAATPGGLTRLASISQSPRETSDGNSSLHPLSPGPGMGTSSSVGGMDSRFEKESSRGSGSIRRSTMWTRPRRGSNPQPPTPGNAV